MKSQRLFLRVLCMCLLSLASLGASFRGVAAVCDANNDKIVDFRDIFIIQVQNLGRRASGPADPKDADRNGLINLNDAAICKAKCAFKGCFSKANKLPKALNDRAATSVNRRITINVVANDRDPDGRIAAATVQITTNPLHGRVINKRNGTVTYIPATGYSGRDSFLYRVKDNRGGLSNVARVTLTIAGKNQPPAANAGLDANAITGQPVTLDGSRSSDPERARLSFSWSFLSRPSTSTLTNASIANRLTAAPNFTPDVDGVYELALSVSDGIATNVDTVRITAASPAAINVPPNVNAGSDQNVLVNTTANLTGTATDPDNGPGALTLTWTFVAPLPAGSTLTDASINNANTLTPSFTPDVVGAYTLRLSANDGAATTTDDVIITAANNVAPNADAGADIVVPLGLVANLNGSASNDPDNRPGLLTYQWSFTTLATGSALTNANINNPTTATASFTPDVLGLYLLRLDVSDGALSGNDQVQVKANVAPLAANDSFTTSVNTALNQAVPGLLANDTDGNNDPLTAVLDSPPANAQAFTLNTDGSFAYTPNNNFTGTDTFTYHANDGSVNGNPPTPVANANSNTATATIEVKPPNSAPSFTKGTDQTVLEDAGSQTVPGWATAIDDGDAGVTQTLTFSVSNSNNSLFSIQPSINPANGALTYTPAANANGSATVTVTLQDNGGTANGGVNISAPQTFTITVNPVNDAPSFTKGADQSVNEDAGAQTVAGWAAAISAGPADESGQTLTFNVTGNTNAALFSALPAVAANGTLTYTPAANANGSATITLNLQDNGGTANAGVNASTPQTFTITINAVNDAPTFTPGGSITVNEDAGAQSTVWASGITSGAANEAGQTLVFSVINSNSGLFSAQPAISSIGVLTFTPAANANGSATITVALTDNGGTANGGINTTAAQVFTITVNPVNDPPVALTKTASAHTNMSISINAGLLTGVTDADAGINGCNPAFAVASITASSGGTVSNINLGAGTFDFNPNPGFTGTAVVNYTVADSGCPGTATSAPAAINITVSGPVIWFVNQAAAGGGNGTLANPFNTLAAADGVDTANHRIFAYSGTYATGLTLNASEWLIGQGATGTSFDNLLSISPPAGTIARPAINGVRPNLQNTISLATSGRVQGLNITPAAGITGLSAGAVSGTNVLETSVTTSNAPAVNLNGTSGTISLTSVSANGGANGIVLQNTGTGLSFTVTGSGGTCTAADQTGCTGGTIQNMTGGDNSTTAPGGTGIVLNSTGSVSLTRIWIHDHSNYGIRGSNVAGFTLANSVINGANGSNPVPPFNDSSVRFTDLSGSASVTNTAISGGRQDNFTVINSGSGSLNRITFSSVTIGPNHNTDGNDGIFLETLPAATGDLRATIQNSVFTSAAGDLLQYSHNGSGVGDLVLTNNAFSNNHPTIATGGGGVSLFADGNTTMNVTGNTFRDSVGTAVLIAKTQTDATAMGVTFGNNTIGVDNLANSGSREGSGLKLQTIGGGTLTAGITSNNIFGYNNFGVEVLAGGGAAATGGNLNVTQTGNRIEDPGNTAGTLSFPKNGIHFNIGTNVGDTFSVCAAIGGAGALANSISTSGKDAVPATIGDMDFRLRQRQATTIRLPGYTGTNNDNTAVQNFVVANNSGDGAPVGLVSNTTPTGGGFVGGAACPLP